MSSTFLNFLGQSSCHGFQQAGKSKSAVKLFMWLTLSCLCTTFVTAMVIGVIRKYLDAKTFITVKIVDGPVPFPAVTFCNINPYMKSRARQLPQIAAMEHVQDVINNKSLGKEKEDIANHLESSGRRKRNANDCGPEKLYYPVGHILLDHEVEFFPTIVSTEGLASPVPYMNIGTGDFSITCWFQLRSSTSSSPRLILDARFDVKMFLEIRVNTAEGMNFMLPPNDWYWLNTDLSSYENDSIWHHLGVVIDRQTSEQVHLYIDGSNITSLTMFADSVAYEFVTPINDWLIGRYHANDPMLQFCGKLNMVSLHRHALTDTEMKNIFDCELEESTCCILYNSTTTFTSTTIPIPIISTSTLTIISANPTSSTKTSTTKITTTTPSTSTSTTTYTSTTSPILLTSTLPITSASPKSSTKTSTTTITTTISSTSTSTTTYTSTTSPIISTSTLTIISAGTTSSTKTSTATITTTTPSTSITKTSPATSTTTYTSTTSPILSTSTLPIISAGTTSSTKTSIATITTTTPSTSITKTSPATSTTTYTSTTSPILSTSTLPIISAGTTSSTKTSIATITTTTPSTSITKTSPATSTTTYTSTTSPILSTSTLPIISAGTTSSTKTSIATITTTTPSTSITKTSPATSTTTYTSTTSPILSTSTLTIISASTTSSTKTATITTTTPSTSITKTSPAISTTTYTSTTSPIISTSALTINTSTSTTTSTTSTTSPTISMSTLTIISASTTSTKTSTATIPTTTPSTSVTKTSTSTTTYTTTTSPIISMSTLTVISASTTSSKTSITTIITIRPITTTTTTSSITKCTTTQTSGETSATKPSNPITSPIMSIINAASTLTKSSTSATTSKTSTPTTNAIYRTIVTNSTLNSTNNASNNTNSSSIITNSPSTKIFTNSTSSTFINTTTTTSTSNATFSFQQRSNNTNKAATASNMERSTIPAISYNKTVTNSQKNLRKTTNTISKSSENRRFSIAISTISHLNNHSRNTAAPTTATDTPSTSLVFSSSTATNVKHSRGIIVSSTENSTVSIAKGKDLNLNVLTISTPSTFTIAESSSFSHTVASPSTSMDRSTTISTPRIVSPMTTSTKSSITNSFYTDFDVHIHKFTSLHIFSNTQAQRLSLLSITNQERGGIIYWMRRRTTTSDIKITKSDDVEYPKSLFDEESKYTNSEPIVDPSQNLLQNYYKIPNDHTNWTNMEKEQMQEIEINYTDYLLSTQRVTDEGDETNDIGKLQNCSAAVAATMLDYLPLVMAEVPNEEIKRIGINRDELIINCTYDGKSCDIETWPHFLHPNYGNCYTFNQNGRHQVFRTSGTSGLKVILKIWPLEYLRFIEYAGVVLDIHVPGHQSFPEVFGVTIPGGKHTKISLSREIIEKVKDCTGPGPEARNAGEYIFPLNYTLEGCLQSCSQNQIFKHCGCKDPKFPDLKVENDSHYCTSLRKICMDAFYQGIDNVLGANCGHCKTPCSDKVYDKVMTQTVWPVMGSRPDLCPEHIKHRDGCHRYIKSNYLSLDVSMQKTTQYMYSERYFYTNAELVSDLAGWFSIMPGASFLTLVEVLVAFALASKEFFQT